MTQPSLPPPANVPPKSHRTRNIVLVAVGVFLGLGTISAIAKPDATTTSASPSPLAVVPQVTATAQSSPADTLSPSAATEATPAATPDPTPKPTPHLTAEQENAIGTAGDYLAYTAFSRSGLIKQLQFEGYSTAVATFAVDHITVNWNEQAYLKAKEYLASSHFSRSGLINQLKYEGFTTKQATYGVTKAGL